eukprot:c32511_g1_i1.p1 GENE.c32511_g1_i1~~c32511_g1_i1.p1  ORF type:complete len:259 (-),score=41.53 c32511_g1_i1:52-795(-)
MMKGLFVFAGLAVAAAFPSDNSAVPQSLISAEQSTVCFPTVSHSNTSRFNYIGSGAATLLANTCVSDNLSFEASSGQIGLTATSTFKKSIIETRFVARQRLSSSMLTTFTITSLTATSPVLIAGWSSSADSSLVTGLYVSKSGNDVLLQLTYPSATGSTTASWTLVFGTAYSITLATKSGTGSVSITGAQAVTIAPSPNFQLTAVNSAVTCYRGFFGPVLSSSDTGSIAVKISKLDVSGSLTSSSTC